MPFTVDQFFDIFAAYNSATFPARWILFAMAVLATAALFWKGNARARFVCLLLAALWLWTGAVYHLYFFTRINGAAYLFGLLFIIQSVIFLVYGGAMGRLQFTRPGPGARGVAGAVMVVFALVVYPLLGQLFGHQYPRVPTFGTPCPTTIFTFGMLMFLYQRPPIYVYAIPFIWSLIGASAAYYFGVYEDLGLLVAGVAGTILLRFQKAPDLEH